MYVVPTTWTSLSALLLFEVAAVVVPLARSGVEVPVTSEALDVAAVGIESTRSGVVVEMIAVASTTGVDVPIIVDVASVRAATTFILTRLMTDRLMMRTLAAEDMATCFFIRGR